MEISVVRRLCALNDGHPGQPCPCKPMKDRDYPNQAPHREKFAGLIGGETGIRTLGTVASTTVFETAPFNHSGTSPHETEQSVSG